MSIFPGNNIVLPHFYVQNSSDQRIILKMLDRD